MILHDARKEKVSIVSHNGFRVVLIIYFPPCLQTQPATYYNAFLNRPQTLEQYTGHKYKRSPHKYFLNKTTPTEINVFPQL